MRAVILDGIVVGLAFGLLGVGMTLVYGLGGVLNLAYGQIVVLAAIVISLLMEDGVATVLAALVGVLAAAGVSVLLDLTLMRPVYRQHGEERTLLGLLLTLGAAFVIGGLLVWRYPAGALYIFVSGDPISVIGVPMSVGSIWASAIALAVAVVLLLFFGATTFGRGVRSVIQDETGARLVGINPCVHPHRGLRAERRACGDGRDCAVDDRTADGQRRVRAHHVRADRHRGRRARERRGSVPRGRAPRRGERAERPLHRAIHHDHHPPRCRRSDDPHPTSRAARAMTEMEKTRSLPRLGRIGRALLPIVVTAAILAVLPPVWFGDSPYTTSLAVQALVFASYGVGFNLIFGSTNQLFLCVGALAGVGGYGAGILANETSLPLAAGVIVGTVSAAIVGGLLSWIAVRRSLGIIFTGIVTLVFSLGFANLLLGQRELTGSETGLIVEGVPADLADDSVGGYYLFAGLLVAFLIVFRALQLSHVGWAFRALRDDEVAAELAGVNVARYRIYAATVGSAMIGLTGALLAYSAGFISPATYSFERVDVRVLVMVAFGGLGTLLGPVVGAAVFAVLDERLTASLELREVLYGVFVIAIFLFFRRGVVQAIVSLFDRFFGSRRSKPAVETSPE